MRFPRSLRPLAGYGMAALVFTWPLVLHPLRLLASLEGPGDAYLNLWIIGWDLRTLATHPAALLTGAVFNANIFYPAPDTLAYSDHFLVQAVAVAPLYLVTHHLALCYNVIFVGSLVASAWAMHVVVRSLLGSDLAAWAAGLAWGFAPYHWGHFGHIQLQALFGLPIAFFFLHRVVTTGRARDACLVGVAAAFEGMVSVYYGVIGAVALAAGGIALWAGLGGRGAPRLLRNGMLAALVGLAVLAPIGYHYWKVQHEGFGRSLFEASQGAAGLRAYLTVPPENLIYGHSGVLASRTDDGTHKAAEQMLFPGFALMALAALGLWHGRRRDTRPLALAFALIGVAGFLLSLGPDGIRPLYAFAHRAIFGFQAIRAPARFAVLVLFALAGLAAIGVRELARTRPRLALAAVALVALEYVNVPLPYVDAPQLDTHVGEWLRDTPEPGAVMYQPVALGAVTTTPFMVQSLIHGRPIVNGYSGLRPAFYDSLAQTMARFPSLETVKALDDLHVRFIVAPEPLAAADLPLVERARFDDGVIYEIQWTTSAAADLAGREARPAAAPVPPGPAPFSPGETAVYRVVWATGPLSIPAGRATFNVETGGTGARLHYTVAATTAAWVSRFFEADDRFDSTVDEALRPTVCDTQLHEGSKRVTRRVTFDRAARVVRLQQGTAPEVSLPVAPGALDPISAIYVLRALPPVAGPPVRLPISDWGKDWTVAVPPGTDERITVGGAARDAIRVEPVVSKSDGQPAGYHLTIWLSRDDRRVPLLMTIDGLAGVGSVRLELESYVAGR